MEREDVIVFEYNGKTHTLTREEINAAHAYVEREFREEDALVQLDYFIFGYSSPLFGDHPENANPGEAEDLADFEEKYGIGYMEARKMKTQFATAFICNCDCDIPENDQWHNAIRDVLIQRKQNGA